MIKWKESATINGLYMRDGSLEGYDQKTEIVTLDGNSPFVMELEEKVHPTMALTATIDGGAAVVLPWRMTPSTGEIAVDRRRGLVKYSSVDAGSILTVIYTPMGSVISVSKLDVVATENAISYHSIFLPGVATASPDFLGVIKLPGGGGQIISITAFARNTSLAYGDTVLEMWKAFDVLGLETGGAIITSIILPHFVSLPVNRGHWFEYSGPAIGSEMPYLYFMCSNAGGHGDITIEVGLQ